MRRFLYVSLIVLLSMVLVIGCSQNNDGGNQNVQVNGATKKNESNDAKNSDDVVTLSYYSWDPNADASNLAIISKFEAEYPNIKIDYSSSDSSSYWTKLSAEAATNTMPDVFEMSTGFLDEWASEDLLLNIQSYVDRDVKEEDYFTSVFSSVRYPDKENGDMYAFPYAWVTTVLYYNKDMLDEANLSYPSKEWTWDDFLHVAQTLTKDTNGDGITDQWGTYLFGRYAQIEGWLYQNDGRLLNEDKTVFEINENGRQTLQFLTDLTIEHKVAPSPKSIEGIHFRDLFAQGSLAMFVDGSFMIEEIRDAVDDQFEWGISTIPRGPNYKEEVTYGWPDNLSISKNTAHPEEAWTFIKYLTGENRTAENFLGGKVPILRTTAESDEWLEVGLQPANKSLILEQGDHLGRTSFTPSWSEWRGYGAAAGSGLNGELDQVFDGEKTLDEAIISVTQFANDVLSRTN